MTSVVDAADDRSPTERAVRCARSSCSALGRSADRLLLEDQDRGGRRARLADADELMARSATAARAIAWTSRTTRGARCGRRCTVLAVLAVARDRPLAPGVVLRDGEVALLADADPAADPPLVLRVRGRCRRTSASRIARPTLRPLRRRAVGRCRIRGPTTRASAFVALCSAAATPWCRWSRLLDQRGLFVRFLPEWDRVRCQARSATRSTASPSTVTCSRRSASAADAGRSGRAGPTCCSWARCCTTSARAGPGDHTDNGIELARDRRHPHGLRRRRRRRARRPGAPPPAPARASPPGATSTTPPPSRRWPTPSAPRTPSTCWPRSPRPTRSPPVPRRGATGRRTLVTRLVDRVRAELRRRAGRSR